MQDPKELTQKIEELQDRISRLNSAILRISRSLDVGTVLQEVVESARELTGAGYGLIATIDESGQVQEFVSSGFTAEEHKQMTDWPEGPLLYEHFRDLPETLRLCDLPTYVRSLGYSSDLLLSKTFQGTPMRHRGVQVGNFFLAEKEGGHEFTSEDEEVLVLFASQAAAAIANARTHGDVHRARADLEALIDMSPVGVAVFDARTGRPVMINREAKRIADSLHMPSLPPEQLLEMVKFRRADGREFSLEEWPFDQALKIGETVRVEEIVLEVPGGRSVTTLINATPIRSEEGDVESMVVTLQDLAPLEDLERSRAEFLGMVSHELRAPLASIKGSATTVLDATPLPNPTEMLQFFRIINEQAKHMHGLISDLLDAEQIETGTLSVSPAPEGVASLVDEARKTFLSGGGRHIVQIDMPANLPRVLADRQRIVQVLNNLLCNASRYAPESSPIQVRAVQDGVHVAITVSDKGRGVPADLLPHLFRKHVSVGGKERGMRGSGLGLAICKGLVEAHGGRIQAESDGTGLGTRVTFTVPMAEEVGTGGGSVTRGVSHASQKERGRPRILVVDDDPETLRYVRNALSAAGLSPLVTGDPEAVSHLIRTKKPQLVLMDLILPGTDGIELMERLPELSDLPVIFISAYGRDETIVRALETGATDYVVKPFSPAELVARVQAALRRHQAAPEAFHLGNLTIHYDQRRVTLAGRTVPLTATEYELLRVLSINAGWVMTHEVLLRRVWGRMESSDAQPVRTFVKKLRRKLGDDAANSNYIVTVRGVGYRMATPSDD